MQVTIIVNGKKEQVEGDTSLFSYVCSRDLDPKTVVVEHNASIVPTDNLNLIVLKENDQLEILRFVGGG